MIVSQLCYPPVKNATFYPPFSGLGGHRVKNWLFYKEDDKVETELIFFNLMHWYEKCIFWKYSPSPSEVKSEGDNWR